MEDNLKSTEHFQNILDEVLPKSNLRESRSRLLEKYKMDEKDVNVAVNLMACIMFFDKRILGDIDTIFSFIPHKAKFETIVRCLVFMKKKTGERKDGYQIYARGISDLIEKRGALMCFTKKGKVVRITRFKEKRRHSLEETLIGIAAHEVRHRLQYHRLIRQLGKKDINICKDKRLVRVIKFTDLVFKEERKIYREKRRPEWSIKKRTKASELDARIVEEIVKNRIHYGCTTKKLCKAILIQS